MVLGDTEKSYAFDIRCERKRYKTLPDLLPLAGAPLSNLNLKRNQLQELPPEGFKGLKFKSIKRKDHPESVPRLQVYIWLSHSFVSLYFVGSHLFYASKEIIYSSGF